MELLTADLATAWLNDHGYADSEANRVGFQLWRGSIEGIEHDDPNVAGALREMRFTYTDDNDMTRRVDALDTLHAAFVRAANPYEHRNALMQLGVNVEATDDDRDGDYPDVGLTDTTTVPDDEAAALGLDTTAEPPTTIAGVTAPDGAGTTIQTPPYDGTNTAAGDGTTTIVSTPADDDNDAALPAFPDTAPAVLHWNDSAEGEPQTGVLWFHNPAGGYAAIPVTTGEHRSDDDGHGNQLAVWHIDVDHETAHAFTHPSARVAGAFHTHNPQRWQLIEKLDDVPAPGEPEPDTSHGMTTPAAGEHDGPAH